MVFAGDLEDRGKRFLEPVDGVSYLFCNLVDHQRRTFLPFVTPLWQLATYMLIDQDDTNVLALLCEAVECLLDLRFFRLSVAHEEVLLRVRRIGDVADAGEEEACD